MDVMQNHTMQVLCLVAMEPPTGPDGIEDLHDFRADVLVSIRALASSGVANRSRRGRYIAGRPSPWVLVAATVGLPLEATATAAVPLRRVTVTPSGSSALRAGPRHGCEPGLLVVPGVATFALGGRAHMARRGRLRGVTQSSRCGDRAFAVRRLSELFEEPVAAANVQFTQDNSMHDPECTQPSYFRSAPVD